MPCRYIFFADCSVSMDVMACGQRPGRLYGGILMRIRVRGDQLVQSTVWDPRVMVYKYDGMVFPEIVFRMATAKILPRSSWLTSNNGLRSPWRKTCKTCSLVAVSAWAYH